MNICHVITLLENNSLAHELLTKGEVDEISSDCFLLKPRVILEHHQVYAVLCKHGILRDLSLDPDNILLALKLLVADDLERKPLLQGQSPARSIFLLSELGNSILALLLALGMNRPKLKPIPLEHLVRIEFEIPTGMPRHESVGAFICMMVLLDSLFFERGLMIKSSSLEFDSRSISSEFSELLKTILLRSYC